MDYFLRYIFSATVLVFVGFLFISQNVNSQSQEGKVIKGIVRETATKAPLPGATVIVKNENGRLITSVLTDLDGRYTIKVTIPNAILQVSFIGFKPTEIPVGNQSVIDVELVSESRQLQEVVVTAEDRSFNGFTDINRKNLASSVSSVDIGKIAPSAVTSVGEMIQGRAAGVQVTSNSGDPGAGVNIKIRGTNSLNASNEPLVVVDGIEFPIQGAFNVNDLTNRANSPLGDINPENIESIDILKDAGALAIYGSKGANGVIVITTKRGKRNSTVINFSSDYSVTQAPRNVPLLSGADLKTFILEGNQNSGNVVSETSIPLPELRDDQTRSDYYIYNNNTDWVKAIQQNGRNQVYNLSLRGGGNTTRYSFSVGNTHQTGTIVSTGYDRLNMNVALDYDISKKLFFRTDIGYTREITDRGGSISNGSGYKYPLDMARSYPSFLPVFNKDKNGNDLNSFYIPNPNDNSLYPQNLYNPVAWIDYVSASGTKNKFWNNITILYDIASGLRLTSKLSVNFTDNVEDAFIPSEATNRNFDDHMINHSFKSNNFDQYIQQQNLISYKKVFREKHDLTLTGISEITWTRGNNFYEESSNSGSSLLQNPSATNVWSTLTSSSWYDVGNSYRGNLHYVYNEKYGLQGTVTYQGSSKFGSSQRYGAFPTVAAFWRISNESFIRSLTFINDIKLRYSWGLTGQEPSQNYLYFNTLSEGIPYINWIGVVPDNIEASSLKWETSAENNIAMDVTLFDNRFSFTIEAYDKLTKDLLLQRSLPSTSGFSTYWTNFGNVRNRGLEFTLNDLRIINGKNLSLNIYGNISTNTNKIEYLPTDNGLETTWDNGYPFMVKQGDPIGAFYGFRYKGVFATDADAVAKDKNGNIIYDLNGQPKKIRFENMNGYEFKGGDAIYEDLNYDGLINDQDRTILGDANPLFDYAFGSRIAYKSLSLDIFFQGRYGNDVINIARKNLEAMTGGTSNYTNQAQSILRRWRKQGDITDMPRATFDSRSHNSEGSDRYVEDGSYLRLKSLAISYGFPTKMLNKVHIKSATLTVNFYNWFTWTNYKGQDPEISIKGSSPWVIGEDKNQTPVPKSMTVGFRLTF